MPDMVLVTGGTGFIASWAIVELLKRGYSSSLCTSNAFSVIET